MNNEQDEFNAELLEILENSEKDLLELEQSDVDFLKRVRADSRFKNLPFLLVTAEAEQAQVAEAIKAGVDQYVVKPFSKDILVTKLESAYKKHALKQG